MPLSDWMLCTYPGDTFHVDFGEKHVLGQLEKNSRRYRAEFAEIEFAGYVNWRDGGGATCVLTKFGVGVDPMDGSRWWNIEGYYIPSGPVVP